jgi:hypothetical protein
MVGHDADGIVVDHPDLAHVDAMGDVVGVGHRAFGGAGRTGQGRDRGERGEQVRSR